MAHSQGRCWHQRRSGRGTWPISDAAAAIRETSAVKAASDSRRGKDSVAARSIRLANEHFGRSGAKAKGAGRLQLFVFSIDSFGCVWLMGVCKNAKRIRQVLSARPTLGIPVARSVGRGGTVGQATRSEGPRRSYIDGMPRRRALFKTGAGPKRDAAGRGRQRRQSGARLPCHQRKVGSR
jgi:hypothetical protein